VSNNAREQIKKMIKRAVEDDGYVCFREKSGAAAGGNTPLFAGKAETLKALYESIKDCRKCVLGASRKNFVFGEGDPEAKLVFVGEAPGGTEDEQGRPFVGKAGKLLDKIIEAIGFKREQVFILNVLKCRPPDNRPPEPEEENLCIPYLKAQLEIIAPKIICTLGNPATHNLLKTEIGITKLRGTIQDYNGIPVIPTYHPSACLRNPNLKVDVWQDVKLLRKEYDRICRSGD